MEELRVLNFSEGKLMIVLPKANSVVNYPRSDRVSLEFIISEGTKAKGFVPQGSLWIVFPQYGSWHWQLIEGLIAVQGRPFDSIRVANGTKLDEVYPSYGYYPFICPL